MTDIASVGIQVDASQVRQATRDLNSLAQTGRTTETSITSLESASRALNATLGALGIGLSAFAVVNAARDALMLADKMTLLDAKIRIATQSVNDFKNAQQALTQISLSTGSSLESNITLFTRLNKSVESMGYSYQTTLGITKTLAQGLKISGASAGEANSVMIQLSQALSSGVLRGDEFNSVMENGSRIVDALTTATGKTRGELRELAHDGKLTAQVVVEALQSQSKAIDEDFGKIPVTIGAALQNINTQWAVLIEHINTATASTGIFANSLQSVANVVHLIDLGINGATAGTDRISVLNRQIGEIATKLEDVSKALPGFYKQEYVQQLQATQLGLVRNRDALVESMNAQKTAQEKLAVPQLAEIENTKKLTEAQKELAQILDGKYKSQIINAANKYGVDPNAALAIAQIETNSGSNIKSSSAGAQGLMQIMPDTANELARQLGTTQEKVLHDMETNIQAGVLYYKQKLQEVVNSGKVAADDVGKYAAAAYNAGFGSLKNNGFNLTALSSETINYAKSFDTLTNALDKINGKQIDVKKSTFEAATADEKYLQTIMQITDAFEKGDLSQAGYNQKMLDAQDALDKASGASDAMKKALKDQAEEWDRVKKAEEDYSKSLGVLNEQIRIAQDNADFASQLKDAGFGPDQIKAEIAQYKEFNAVVAANPNLNPNEVRKAVATRIEGETEVRNATQKKAEEASDFAKQAWKQAARNIQNSLADSIENALNGKGIASLQDFANSIKTTLFSAISNALSAGIINAFAKQNWGDLLSGVITVGATILSGIFSKSATKTVSPSTTTAATYTGSGSFAIADTGARDYGYQFALDSAKQWNEGIKNSLGGVKNVAISYLDDLKAFGSKIIGSEFIKPVKELFSPVTDAIKSGLESISEGLSTGASKLAGSATKVLGYIGALYSVYDYFSSLGDMIKRGNVVQILSNTGMMIGAVVALFNPLIGGLIALGSFIVSLFSNIRTPNYWVNSFSPSNLQKADAASNVMGEDSIYTRTGNKSAFIGTNTAFGQFEISSHELSLTADEMRNQFGDIVKTVRNADNSLAASLNALDVKFGQAGQTMALFAASLLKNRIATQQDAGDLNIGSALDTRYAGISSKLAEGGTQAGVIASSWFNMLMGKFSEEAKKDNPGLSVGIAQFLGQALPALAELPVELVGLVSQSISVLTKDHPGEDLVKQSLKVVEGFAKVKYGFETLGATATGVDIVRFLGALTSIGINAGDSAEQLVAYAAALKSTGQTLTDDFLGNLLNATKGLSKDQLGGYLSSFTLFASIAQGLNLKPTNAELDGLSNRLNNVASEANAAANEQIKQSIAANGLGNMSREAAVQQLILSGKLEKSTAEAAVFGTAIVNAQKPVVDAANFIAGVLAGTGTSINKLGISMGNIDGVAQTLITRFGDIKTAISETADFIQTVFGKDTYTKYANNQAVTTQGDILASHPEWAALGFKAGMDSAALEQVTKNWTGDMLASAIKVFATDPDAAAFKNAAKQLTQVISGNTGPITFDTSFGKPATPPAAIPDAEVPRYTTGSSINAVDTTQLEIRLATALGEKQKALNLTREAEMRAVDSTSASILKEIYRAEDLNNARDAETARQTQAQKNAQDAADQQKRLEDQQKQAAETAHQRQVAMANKQIELLNLQGFGLAATALSRQLEIDAMDESLRPMQRLKYILEDQAKAADLLTQALDNYKSAAKDAASFLNDFRKSISSWVDGKKATSIGSPETQLGSAQSSAMAQYQKALAGDKSALGSITTYADNYLSAIDKYYGGNAKGEELKAQIIEAMKALPDQLTPEQIMEDGFKKTVDALNDLPSKIAALQSHLTNDIAAMVMHIDISANMPQELKDLAKTVGGQILFTVDAIASSKLPDPIRLLAMGIEKDIGAGLNLLTTATLDPVLITMGLNTAGVLNKDVLFYITTPGLSQDVINLGLNTTKEIYKYATYVISADASNEVKALGLNVLGVADKYARMIITSDLDTPAKILKLGEANDFIKSVGLSLATTGHLTPDQEKVINSLGYGNISATQTLNQNVVTNGSQLGLTIAGGALTNPNATVSVNSTLAWDVNTVNKTFQSIIDNTFNTASILSQWLPAIHDGTFWTKEFTKWTANNVVAGTEALVRRSYGIDGNPTTAYKTFAKGGYYPGGMALVGEEGPELINFRNPGQVYTAPQTQQIMSGDNRETVEMLKKQIEILNANIQVMQEGFRQLVAQGKKQNESLDNIERDTRRSVAA